MKKAIAFTVLAATAALASAQEQARVLSATPIVQQVAIPRQVCSNETVYTGQRTTGGGAVLGAIAGGAAGNAVGKGSGRAAATAIGVIGGAVLGNHIEGQGRPQYENVQRCGTETYYENRTVGYNVVYEYAGKQYNVQLPQDPGPTIPLQVTPMSAPRSEAPASTFVSTLPPATVVTESRVVYVPAPVYRSYPPVYTSINLGWGWGGGHRHGHWR